VALGLHATRWVCMRRYSNRWHGEATVPPAPAPHGRKVPPPTPNNAITLYTPWMCAQGRGYHRRRAAWSLVRDKSSTQKTPTKKTRSPRKQPTHRVEAGLVHAATTPALAALIKGAVGSRAHSTIRWWVIAVHQATASCSAGPSLGRAAHKRHGGRLRKVSPFRATQLQVRAHNRKW
jgi:hypothetical protein